MCLLNKGDEVGNEDSSNARYSHAIYSDDHGATWQLGGRSPTAGVNECLAVEISGNRLMMNMRNASRGIPQQTMLSADGGVTWTDQMSNRFLPEPRCQAGFYELPQTRFILPTHKQNR